MMTVFANKKNTINGERQMHIADIIEPGTKYNKWTVVAFKGYNKSGAIYDCECECGFVQPVTRKSLIFGKSKQCNRCAIKIRKAAFRGK